jgi:hypothetical protein
MNEFAYELQDVPEISVQPEADAEKNQPQKIVETSKPRSQGSEVVFMDVELWPEPVSGAETLSQISKTLTRFTVLPEGAADGRANGNDISCDALQ